MTAFSVSEAGRIARTGNESYVLASAGPDARAVDLQGRFVTPVTFPFHFLPHLPGYRICVRAIHVTATTNATATLKVVFLFFPSILLLLVHQSGGTVSLIAARVGAVESCSRQCDCLMRGPFCILSMSRALHVR